MKNGLTIYNVCFWLFFIVALTSTGLADGATQAPEQKEPTASGSAPPAETPEQSEQKTAANQAQVHIDSIYPTTAYPSAIHKRYNFEISGQNLAAKAEDNIVELIDKGAESMGVAQNGASAKQTGRYDKPSLEVHPGMETRKLRVVACRINTKDRFKYE